MELASVAKVRSERAPKAWRFRSKPGVEFVVTPSGTIAIIDGALPTAHEWSRIAEDRALVNVLSMPARSESLAALLPFAEHLSRLAVNSATCNDLTGLEELPGLEWLVVGGVVSRPPNAEKLTSLRFFGGDPAHMPGITGLPSILGLNIKWHPNVLDSVSESTTDLTLTEAGRLTDLSGVARLKGLEKLAIHGSRSLSLRGVDQLKVLTSLTLESITRVTDTLCLLGAPALGKLTLEDCPDFDQPDALRAFPGDVRVIGRHPFSLHFQASAGPGWTFPPERRR